MFRYDAKAGHGGRPALSLDKLSEETKSSAEAIHFGLKGGLLVIRHNQRHPAPGQVSITRTEINTCRREGGNGRCIGSGELQQDICILQQQKNGQAIQFIKAHGNLSIARNRICNGQA